MLAYLIGRPPNWEISVNQLTKASDKDVTNTSLANKSCLEGEKKGGGVVLNQTLVQRTTRVYDSALYQLAI